MCAAAGQWTDFGVADISAAAFNNFKTISRRRRTLKPSAAAAVNFTIGAHVCVQPFQKRGNSPTCIRPEWLTMP